MSLSQRDRRALAGLGIAALAAAVYWFATSGGAEPAVAQSDSIPAAERRLARVRQQAETVSGKRQVLKAVSDGTGAAGERHHPGRDRRAGAGPAARHGAPHGPRADAAHRTRFGRVPASFEAGRVRGSARRRSVRLPHRGVGEPARRRGEPARGNRRRRAAHLRTGLQAEDHFRAPGGGRGGAAAAPAGEEGGATL